MRLPSFISNLFKSRKQREAEHRVHIMRALERARTNLQFEIAKAKRAKKKHSHLEARLNSVLNQMLSLELKKAGR